MARKPVDTRNFTLRMRESLGRRLEAAAQKNRRSLNNEIVSRLEASLEKAAVRDLEAIAADMKERYSFGGLLFRRLTLEEQLARALETGDFEKAKPLASDWLKTRGQP
jgi:Arc-like DNA binding domain